MIRRILLILLVFPVLSLADDGVYLQVLGIAQDAGYPQANCYQPHCMRAWNNPDLRRLTSSIAVVDTNAKTKYLFDATPDIREQLFHLHQITVPRPRLSRRLILTPRRGCSRASTSGLGNGRSAIRTHKPEDMPWPIG